MWLPMSRLGFPLSGPISDARKRKEKLEGARLALDRHKQPDEYERLSGQISAEDDLIASFTDFKKERRSAAGKRKMG